MKEKIIVGALLIILCVLLSVIFAYPFMLAWNYAVVVAIDFANPITYWQAYMLVLATSILFKGGK